jgi:hypothetical protein
MVWWGAPNGRVVTKAVPSPVRFGIAGGLVVSRRASSLVKIPRDRDGRNFTLRGEEAQCGVCESD